MGELKAGFKAVEMGYTRYLDFKGRSSRSEFWWWVLYLIVASMITRAIDVFALGTDPVATGLVNTVWGLATFIPQIAISVRRLHDTNKSAWLMLLLLVPLIGIVVFFWWTIKAGDGQSNRYG